MRPCQSVRGLPPDVAAWLLRWRRRRNGAVGRCWSAMRERPEAVQREHGMAVTWEETRHGLHVRAITHTWGRLEGRVIDPTAHQWGDHPIRLYRWYRVCPTCSELSHDSTWTPENNRCGCWRTADGLSRLVMGPVYEEVGAPGIEMVLDALTAREAT